MGTFFSSGRRVRSELIDAVPNGEIYQSPVVLIAINRSVGSQVIWGRPHLPPARVQLERDGSGATDRGTAIIGVRPAFPLARQDHACRWSDDLRVIRYIFMDHGVGPDAHSLPDGNWSADSGPGSHVDLVGELWRPSGPGSTCHTDRHVV